jgi:hypothetical protein
MTFKNSVDCFQGKILPIFHLTNFLKAHLYAHAAYLCVSFFGSQEINVDVGRKGAPMSTHRGVGPRHALQSESKDKNRIVMTDALKAYTRSNKHIIS